MNRLDHLFGGFSKKTKQCFLNSNNDLFLVATTQTKRSFRLFTAILALLAALTAPLPATADTAPETVFVLNGMHRMQSGDDLLWRNPGYDDSNWKSTYLPDNFNLLDEFKPYGMVWYRIHFVTPAVLLDRNAAFFLGRIADADQAYLNGVEIGSTGSVSEGFVEAGNIYRCYRIPRGLLKPAGENVLAIRTKYVQNYWGFFDDRILIGDYTTLALDTLRKASRIEVLEGCFITGLLLTLVGCSFLYMQGTRDREYVFLWLFVAAFAGYFVTDSNMFYTTGIQTPLMQQLVFTSLTLASVFLAFLLTYACRVPFSLPLKAVVATLLLVALSHLVTLPPAGNKLQAYTRFLVLGISAIYFIYIATKAYLERKPEAGTILTGVIFYVAGSRMELMSGITFQKYSVLFPIDYAMAMFLLCMMYAMTARFNRIRENLKQMTEKVLDAHEQERKRIARDIHDVIGQGLLATKLNLQILKSKITGSESVRQEDLDQVISDTSSQIDEIRLIAMELRPSFIENMDFADAITWHARNFEKKSGTVITVEAEPAGDLPVTMKDNLYRIYQEALSNAVKHSGADSITVRLAKTGGIIRLEIADTGRGFDSSSRELYRQGIGLSSITERAQLIGGTCSIKSSDKGTIITVEVAGHD